MSGITVYTKPHCQQCRSTFRALDKAGLDYTAVDISVDTEARESQCGCQHGRVSDAA